MIDNFGDLFKRKNSSDRKKLIEEYAPLVKKIAGRISMNLPSSVDINDLISYGVFGLIDAIEKYKPELNVKFDFYAARRISGSIYDGLRKLDWAPRNIRSKTKELEKIVGELEQELGRDVNDEEVAKKMGISLDELEKIYTENKKSYMLSIEEFFTAETDDMDKASFMADQKMLSPEEQAEQEAVKKILVNAINGLVYNERLVVTLYYYNEFTLKEIALTLDLTESRVSQIHSRALVKLKGKLRNFKKNII
ncbi:MAG: FliA/WhiG family RNA polymerase sigma factor [Candidatus Muiribacteriota bacterium]|jgi:RNA polymerase sigma factor for flagellar operon FliA